ncbi:hypothetical protein [Flexithrix dorotheae]|uniref:hypothetical protein n=1 Tax=Flexithrix dorotheae TaxID=70993 RepID=UPI000362FBD3|nr:hypothetical protein [Flexithrix dorotheae]
MKKIQSEIRQLLGELPPEALEKVLTYLKELKKEYDQPDDSFSENLKLIFEEDKELLKMLAK